MNHRAKKSLGQNFLKSKKALSDMIAAGNVNKEDTVLEIGPGKGALTTELLQHAGLVIAIEKDHELVLYLKEKFAQEIAAGKLELIHGDILEMDSPLRPGLPGHLPFAGEEKTPYKVIANIPYYITGALFRMFLEREAQPSAIVFLVQKEVAERIVAKGSKPAKGRARESILSLSVKAYGTPKYVSKVAKHYFSPAPKVDSAIISISNISQKAFKDAHISSAAFFQVVKAGFAHKRKVLIQNLTELGIPKEIIEKAFQNLSIPPKTRAENVELPLWIALTKALSAHIHTK